MPRGPKTGMGNTGGLPDDIILAKYERTNLRENPEMLDYHQRSILKDSTPDRPFMEADEPFNGGYDPRDGSERQGGSYSRSKLALRGIGKRSWVEPHLPDGSFLDWHGLERDPRSIRPDPDFQNMVKQSAFRGRYIPYFSDADNSVPETGMNTYQRWQSIRETQRWAADRMKWFDTGKDNRTSRRAGQSIPNEHRKVQVTVDGEVINLNDAVTANKSNLTDLLTNQYKVGWRRTTDQDFKVAKYGQVRPTTGMGNQKWYKNLRYGEDSRVDLGVFQDQVVPKTLVKTLENIIRARGVQQQLTDSIPWRSSYGLKNYKDPYIAANYRGGSDIGFRSVEDRATEIVRLLQNSYINRKDAMLAMPDRPNSHVGFSWLNTQLVDYMDMSNRKIGPLDVKMILKNSALLSKELGYHITDYEDNVKIQALPSAYKPVEASWHSKDDERHKGSSLLAANYTNISPAEKPGTAMLQMLSQEDYKARQDKSLHYANKPPPGEPTNLIAGYLSQDQDFALDRERRGAMNGPLGGKYTRKWMDTTHKEGLDFGLSVNDMDNK